MSEKFSPSPVLSVLGGALEHGINRVLALDARTHKQVAQLEGRSMDLRWSGPEIAMRLTVKDGRIGVGPVIDNQHDLSIAATLKGLAAMLVAPKAGAPPTGRIKMSGDVELARHVSELANKFQPDLEAGFAKVLGDSSGPLVARAAQGFFDWAKTSASTLAEDAAEYVTEESRDVVSGAELEPFYDAVDKLRDAGERLAARVTRLQSKLDEDQSK